MYSYCCLLVFFFFFITAVCKFGVFFSEKLKFALRVEIKAWKLLFGKELNNKFKNKMEEVLGFVDENSTKLARPIKDLQDVKESMSALADIRNNQIHLDMSLGPIEVRECFF